MIKASDVIRIIKQCLDDRKKIIYSSLKLDKDIGADTYTNIARLKEIEKVEKCLDKIKG